VRGGAKESEFRSKVSISDSPGSEATPDDSPFDEKNRNPVNGAERKHTQEPTLGTKLKEKKQLKFHK
jgi:hypothetical protein